MALIYDLQFTGTVGTLIDDGGGDYAPDVGAKWKGLPAFIPHLNGSGNAYVPSGEGQRQAVSPANTTSSVTVVVEGLQNGETNRIGILLRWPYSGGSGDLFSGGYRVVRKSFSDGVAIEKDNTQQVANSTFTGNYNHFDGGAGDKYHIQLEDISSQPRIRVWTNANTGAHDLEYTDTSGSPYTAGRVGLYLGGNSNTGAFCSRIRVYDEILAPGFDAVIPPNNQDPRRILSRITRARSFQHL